MPLEIEADFIEGRSSRAIPDPGLAKALRRIRRTFMEVLEDDHGVNFLALNFGGNGECTLDIGGDHGEDIEVVFRARE